VQKRSSLPKATHVVSRIHVAELGFKPFFVWGQSPALVLMPAASSELTGQP
jgi:hypothetical protein